jgi:hypothetical protein
MKLNKKVLPIGLVATLCLGMGAMSARAQGENTSADKQKNDPPKPAGTTSPVPLPIGDADSADGPAYVPAGPPNPYVGQIKKADSGLPLLGTSQTPLRWGNFSISSFEYIGIHDRFDPKGQPAGAGANLSILRSSLMYDFFYWKKNRIVLQYVPQIVILDGKVRKNGAANNNLSLGTMFQLSPRLSLTVQDSFVHVQTDQLVPDEYLKVDGLAGALVQNNFLVTNGSYLADTVAATLQYGLSARTTITVSPSYRYARATNDKANYLAVGQTYQGIITIGHALTPHRTVGATESYLLMRQSTAAGPATARFNTTGFFYSEQLARSFWVTAHVGAEHQSFTDLPGADHWSLVGGLSVIENLSNRIGLTAAYVRGETFNHYISRQRSDRLDGSLGIHLTRRITWTTTTGFYRELGADPRTSGKYGTSGVDYNFIGNYHITTLFAYTFQDSNTPQLVTGTRRTAVIGLRWQAPVYPGK